MTPEATLDPLPGKCILSFAPVTPDKSLRVCNKEGSEILNLDVDDIEDQERATEKNKITTKMVNINELNSDKSLRPATDSLAAADSTALQENQTPQQKPRRKKHRPKVIIEAKPRTRKPVTPKPADSNKNSTGKRKYVRKNKIEKAQETPPEVAGQCHDTKMLKPRKKTCRRALNFEEMQPEADDSRYCSSNVSSEPQVHHYSTRRSLSKSTIELCSAIEVVIVGKRQEGTVHETYSTHGMDASCMSERETETIRTSVPVKTSSPLMEMNQEVNKDVQLTARNQHENSAQVLSERNTRPCSTSPNDSDCSSSGNLTEAKHQAKGSNRDYHYAVKQADTGSSNMAVAHSKSLETYLISCFPHNKRKRSDKGQGQNNTTLSATYCGTAKGFAEIITAYPQNDTKDNPYGSKTSNLMSPESNRNKVSDNLQTNAECIIMALSPNEMPTKKRSRSATRARDLASLTMIAGHNTPGTYPTKLPVLYKNEQRVENFNKPNSCVDALIAQTRSTPARRRRSKMRNSPAVQHLAFQHDPRSYSKISGTSTKNNLAVCRPPMITFFIPNL